MKIPAGRERPLYIQSQTFFDYDRWEVHDKVGELLAQGVTQITIALVGDGYTVSWPIPRAPALIPEGIKA